MKFRSHYITAFLALTALFVSCSDNDTAETIAGTVGNAQLYFDNGIDGSSLSLGKTYTNANGEHLTISRLTYIISNIVFIKEDGTEYAYPKTNSYFVVNHETQSLTVKLENIPAGDYKKVRFGVGVDKAQYQLGQAAQQTFWDLAVANKLGTDWASGYRFLNFEGTFTSAAVTTQTPFAVHTGNSSSADNYREVTLLLPTTARVRTTIAPSIHIKTDINLLLDGANKIVLGSSLDAGGTSATIDTGVNVAKIADNTPSIFKVDHVHNESGDDGDED